MSTIDTVISVFLLVSAGVLVGGWLLVQLAGEVLYRVWERPLSSLRPRGQVVERVQGWVLGRWPSRAQS